MHLTVVIAVIIYEVAVIIGVSFFLTARQKHKLSSADMVSSGGNMNLLAYSATIALTSLGGGHILGLPGQSTFTGVGTFWFIIGSGFSVVIICCFVGPWYRRLKITTVAGLFEKLFDKKVAILLAGMTADCTWGVITLEMQGVGTVLWAMTGWPIMLCCVVGGIISILYVIFAGMKEVAWVNVINAIFMYVGVIIATIYLGQILDGGWGAVNEYYTSSGNSWMLSLWANGDTWRTYIIGTVLGQLFFMPMNQAGCQCAISAKNVRTLKRSIFLSVPLNCIFGIFMIAFGMAAATMPQYADYYGTPLATFSMLVDLLPTWVVIWLLAGFAAAILSTVAVCVLGLSTVFTDAIVKTYYKPNMTDRQYMRYLRVAIVVFAGIACALSTLMPSVNTSMIWLNAWLLPAFWLFVFGMYWKRSSKAAFITIVISAIANCIWTFGDFGAKLHLDNNNSLVMLFFTLVVGLIATAADRGALPGLVSLYKKDKSLVVSPD